VGSSSICPALRRAESLRVEQVWVLRRHGVRRAKAGERYKGGAEEGNEGDEESVGRCFDLFFLLCPSQK
jgi:hypothetical protein